MCDRLDIYVAVGQGGILPGIELCKRLTLLNCRTSLVTLSTFSASVPDTFRQNTTTELFEIPEPEVGLGSGSDPSLLIEPMRQSLSSYVTTRRTDERGPVGAILDVGLLGPMNWLIDIFSQKHIPVAGFFTSSAYSTTREYVAALEPEKNSGGLIGWLLGCGFFGSGPGVIGLSGPGDTPPWVGSTNKFMGAMINTCDDLERPFIEGLSKKLKLRVWGVGPLLPREYFRLAVTDVRASNEGEARVINWLDSKPPRSVLLVSFETSVDPTTEEYPLLADALGSSTHPFIWVVRPESHSGGYYPRVNDAVGGRGLITSEMIPSCKILNHRSTAGFLSHCSWEPLMEAIGLGKPVLAWPKTGDQFYNAKLVVESLKVGYYVCHNFSQMVKGKGTVSGIGKGIDRLMSDKGMRKRAGDLSAKFDCSFPESSRAVLDQFTEHLALL
ncbi:hypothetical protein Tsubulata_027912 [Turnera subulata]|uniref:Glycosyltransferase n=1 Tax=Turnera subulata TaxID=218843 RepID=A0A9Q0GM05_9ROSI|nr:hypothetical protein Tsubulata_027912 [Turnera subulata]